ncbi:MAG: hypothetical protein AB7G28_24390 [Pirellulales bacterium]
MAHDATIEERVQELSWALFDEQINDDEMQLLEGLLLSDDHARKTYCNCVRLHTDLFIHFAKPAVPSADGKTQVLGFLGGALPPTSTLPTTS